MPMIIATTDAIPGRTITSTLGLVQGHSVRARHVGVDIVAAFRNLVGGEVTGYSRLLAGAREEALQRMTQAAEAQGANAVVGVRLATALGHAGRIGDPGLRDGGGGGLNVGARHASPLPRPAEGSADWIAHGSTGSP